MLTRSLVIVLASATLVAVGCGATQSSNPGSVSTEVSSEPLVLTGFDPLTGETMSALALRLGEESPLKAASLSSSPPALEMVEGLTPPVGERDRWLAIMVEDSPDEDQRLRAYWYGLLAIGGLWQELRDRNSEIEVWGGEVRFIRGSSAVREPGLDGFVFTPGVEEYVYRDSSGKPIASDVDRVALEARVRAQADELGLTLERIAFPGAIGTAVEIEASAAAPIAFFGGGGLSPLIEQTDHLEGVFINVRDAHGDRVVVQGRVAGIQRGFVAYGAAYNERRAAALDKILDR